jgi:transcriptional regulator with XRE-family HTH domain
LLERGEREPRIGTLLKLAGPLEVSPLELLEGIAWDWQDENPRAGAFLVGDERVR